MKYVILLALTALFFSTGLEAYVGPGAGVGVIGAIVGVLLAVIMAILGIFWYPIKRMFKKKESDETLDQSGSNSEQQQQVANEEKEDSQ